MLTLAKPLQKSEAALALSIDRTMREKLPALPNPIVADLGRTSPTGDEPG